MWLLDETYFDRNKQHHKETIFTIGNGYLSTRGAFEEGFPGERRATFVHGVFDDVPIVFTELANTPDWLGLIVILNGERFSLDQGEVESFYRCLDLSTGVLTRRIQWRSPSGLRTILEFQRFASLADEHRLHLHCQVTPDFDGTLEIRTALTGYSDNEGFAHWEWLGQGLAGPDGQVAYLSSRTRTTATQLALAMRVESTTPDQRLFWDAPNVPTFNLTFSARRGETITVEKIVGIATSRDSEDPISLAVEHAAHAPGWQDALTEQSEAWGREWARSDVLIEGDPEAQVAVRFSLFQLLIAAPRRDNRVNIGAKTLSGFGYRGHCFWDTELFMLPFFIYTSAHTARNLLDYRYQRLPAARARALSKGYDGAQFPWESADTGEEVTPTWVPHLSDKTFRVRIWTGDIEIHISAVIAYAAHHYWRVTGDDAWFIEKGAEIVLDTANFWAARAERDERGIYGYRNVIGPDEYHEHVDNNFFTNYMARWNLQTALEVIDWLKQAAAPQAEDLMAQLGLTAKRLAKWRNMIDNMCLPVQPDGLIEQFEGYFQRRDVDLAALEPRAISVQQLYGIEGCNETQVLKQPDVLMLQYILPDHFSDEQVRVNYEYYTPRTDFTHGSSLGPSIQAIMACRVGSPSAYEHFMRAARADLEDVRNNAGDGIHGASAGGTWQAVVFGFGGLRVTPEGWTIEPRLPQHWKRLSFQFSYRGEAQVVDISNPVTSSRMVETASSDG
jgi:kojibiose phosphorylase